MYNCLNQVICLQNKIKSIYRNILDSLYTVLVNVELNITRSAQQINQYTSFKLLSNIVYKTTIFNNYLRFIISYVTLQQNHTYFKSTVILICIEHYLVSMHNVNKNVSNSNVDSTNSQSHSTLVMKTV